MARPGDGTGARGSLDIRKKYSPIATVRPAQLPLSTTGFTATHTSRCAVSRFQPGPPTGHRGVGLDDSEAGGAFGLYTLRGPALTRYGVRSRVLSFAARSTSRLDGDHRDGHRANREPRQRGTVTMTPPSALGPDALAGLAHQRASSASPLPRRYGWDPVCLPDIPWLLDTSGRRPVPFRGETPSNFF